MLEELKNAAMDYANQSGYENDVERDQRAYDFEEGEKHALKMLLDMYLDGKINLSMVRI